MSLTATLPVGAARPRPPHSYTYSYGDDIRMVSSPSMSTLEANGKPRSVTPVEIPEDLLSPHLENGERPRRMQLKPFSPTAGKLVQWFRTRKGRVVLLSLIAGCVLAFTLAFGQIVLVRLGDHGAPEVLGVGGAPPRQDGIFLYGGIRKWDMGEKTLSLRWIPHNCSSQDPGKFLSLQVDASFFINGDALGIDGFTPNASVLDYQVAQADLRFKGWEQYIELDVGYSPRSGELNVNGLETDSLYPFDWYRVQILFAATTGDLSGTYPVIGADIFNKLQTQWIASLNYTYLDNFSPGHATKLAVWITLRRNHVVKASAMLILVFNWLVALALLYMTLVYTLGRRQLPDGLDSIALPFAGLFALPSVRSVMPGDPPFGCLIDFVGIIPNLCIVAGCATFLLLSRIHREANALIPKREREATK